MYIRLFRKWLSSNFNSPNTLPNYLWRWLFGSQCKNWFFEKLRQSKHTLRAGQICTSKWHEHLEQKEGGFWGGWTVTNYYVLTTVSFGMQRIRIIDGPKEARGISICDRWQGSFGPLLSCLYAGQISLRLITRFQNTVAWVKPLKCVVLQAFECTHLYLFIYFAFTSLLWSTERASNKATSIPGNKGN